MSIQAVAWALKLDVGSPTLKLVLIAVSNYADEYGECWPSQARLARDCCLTERSVRESLLKLEGMGLIVREDRFDDARRRQTDLIRLNGSHRNVVPLDRRPERHAEATGTSRQKPPERGSDKPSVEPSKNHHAASAARTKANRQLNYTEEFCILWEMVPKDDNPGSKADAFKAFDSLTAADRKACINGWMEYLDRLEEKRKKKPDWGIKQCVTFINQRYWETYEDDAA